MPPPERDDPEQETYPLSIEQHRTDQVYAVIQLLVENGTTNFRPGDIADALREKGVPLLNWEIRAELATLEVNGQVSNDPATGAYSLIATERKAGQVG
jgi:hypothetical protein